MKSKIILNLAVSLDGFIADENGGYDWIQSAGNKHINSNEKWSHEQFLSHVSVVVMGMNCYRQDMHLEYANKEVYVVTSKSLNDYDNIHFVSDICSVLKQLQKEIAGDIYLFGGGVSIDPILKAGMIDEYIIGIIPVILGDGIPLFHHGHKSIPLYLTHSYVEDGVVILRYVPRINENSSV